MDISGMNIEYLLIQVILQAQDAKENEKDAAQRAARAYKAGLTAYSEKDDAPIRPLFKVGSEPVHERVWHVDGVSHVYELEIIDGKHVLVFKVRS